MDPVRSQMSLIRDWHHLLLRWHSFWWNSTPLNEAASIAEQIRLLATQPIELDNGCVSSSLSIGVTVAVPGENPDALIARADDAMYRAKKDGRNKVVRISHE